MVVAFIFFSAGSIFSVYEGWLRYTHPHTVENVDVALFVLMVALGLEYLSLRRALATIQHEKGKHSLWRLLAHFGQHFGCRVFFQGLGQFKKTVCARAACMDDALGNTLMVEMGYFLA
ncbi:hypothetical protein MGMO_159c00110 [Methyloglobulus morosus KoM1]|uniref:Uncharacterized protein n=1 Tax=Methyloglobulus morosus KoM1 TaxID=1116472 RepID=V5BIZ0_9GAMM|nr:hypothetical protein MGMO_159c00110 [Methyloglobulus morosus KoM1]